MNKCELFHTIPMSLNGGGRIAQCDERCPSRGGESGEWLCRLER